MPRGSISALSATTIAVATTDPVQVEVWDWTTGKQLQVFKDFGSFVLATAALPDGRIVAAGESEVIKTMSVGKWLFATSSVKNNSPVFSLLAFSDGIIVTSDKAGKVKFWQDGKSIEEFSGAVTSGGRGNSMAMVGDYLVYVGDRKNLRVVEFTYHL